MAVLTFYGSVTVYTDRSGATIRGRDISVSDADLTRPVTISEGAEPGSATPKNDWTYAVTIWPGWDTRGADDEHLCHACYAARRQRGWPVSVHGPLMFHDHYCVDCYREIPMYGSLGQAPFFAKKRPAHWEV